MIGAGRRAAIVVRPRPPGRVRLLLLGVLLLVCLLAAANAHLVYVALVSQPDCVPHLETVGAGGTYRAARSSC